MLSIQLAITLVVASVMSRVGPFFSFARWLLTKGSGLVRYVHPDDEELRQLANLPPRKVVNPAPNGSSSRGGRKNRNQQQQANGTGDVFTVPKSIDVQLDTANISVHDIVQLRFYAEYQALTSKELLRPVKHHNGEVLKGIIRFKLDWPPQLSRNPL